MIDRCQSYRGVHIPGCMGCAVYGHDGCTCPARQEHVAGNAAAAKVIAISRSRPFVSFFWVRRDPEFTEEQAVAVKEALANLCTRPPTDDDDVIRRRRAAECPPASACDPRKTPPEDRT